MENVGKDGAAVLNADDPLVAEMAAATNAPVVYFATSPHNHIISAHLASGGRAVVVDHGVIVLAAGDDRVDLVELDRVPFTAGGTLAFQVQNALAATAAAWACGLTPAFIVRALTTFTSDHATVPGRFNVSDLGGVQVILDYGHNVAALRALGEAIATMPKRRTVLMIGLPGDRRDDDLRATIVVEPDHTFSVIGAGAVYVVDGTGITYSSLSEEEPQGIVSIHDVKLHVLAAGDSFDLNRKRPLRGERIAAEAS